MFDFQNVKTVQSHNLSGELVPAYRLSREQLNSDIVPVPQDTITVTLLGEVSYSGNKQGACTDGQYIYQTCGDATDGTWMQILKYNISSKEVTTKRYDGVPNFGHGNDMVYNPNNGYLYICTMLSDGSVVVLNASDLNYVNTIYLKDFNDEALTVYQFCFDRNNKEYYVSYNSGYLVYDEQWNLKRFVNAYAFPNATAQGCETDGRLIYRITYGSNSSGNYGNNNGIDILTLDGSRLKHSVLALTGEPEAIMYDWDGEYYLSTYGSTVCKFYILHMFSQVNLASEFSNWRKSPDGTISISNNVLSIVSDNQSQISGWKTWIGDSKYTMWDAVKDKTVVIEFDAERSSNLDDDGNLAIYIEAYINAQETAITGASKRIGKKLDNVYNSGHYRYVVDVNKNTFNSGGTLDLNADTSQYTVGLLFFSLSLDEFVISNLTMYEVI